MLAISWIAESWNKWAETAQTWECESANWERQCPRPAGMIHVVSFSSQVLSLFCDTCWESSLCLKSSRFDEIYGLLMKLILFFLTSQVIQKFFLKVKNAYVCVSLCVYIFLLIPVTICFCYLVTKSCLILCDPIDCNLPCPSVHGVLQARMLE